MQLMASSAGGCNAAVDQFHIWADENDWKTPNSVLDGPYQHAYSTNLSFMAYLQANQPLGEQFNYHMGGYHQGRPSWMDEGFYPVKERLVKGFDLTQGDAMLVDIGGNVGHDLEELCQKHPDIPGRLFLQDLPIVIGQIKKLDEKVERMAYDFHTEQPIKGMLSVASVPRSMNLTSV